MVTLVVVAIGGVIIVLVSDFYKTQVKGLGMAVGCTFSAPFGRDSAVAVFYRVQRFLDIFIYLVVGFHPTVSHSHVDHKQGFCAQVFRELQHLMES